MNFISRGGKIWFLATSATSSIVVYIFSLNHCSYINNGISAKSLDMKEPKNAIEVNSDDSGNLSHPELLKNKFHFMHKVWEDLNSMFKETRDAYDNLSMGKAKQVFNQINPIGRIAAWFHSRSHHPLVLVELSRSIDPIIRLMGIKSLAEMTEEWQDWQFTLARQALDFESLVALARYSQYTDGRIFPRPPPLPDEIVEIGGDHNLRSLLQLFPPPNSDKSLGAFCDFSLFHENSDLLYHDPSFDAESVKDDINAITNLNYKRLSAIAIHTSYVTGKGGAVSNKDVANNTCRLLVRNKGLQILQQVAHCHGSHPNTLCRIAEIIGNVCQYPEHFVRISQSGWLSILVEWSRSQNLGLSLRAFRALANLDSPQEKSVYPPGFYLCHPVYTSTPNPFLNYSPDYYRHDALADIYFIHGLMGDPIRTWRVADRPASVIANESLKRARTPLPDVRQICWPKEWLGKDFPGLRIMLLGYDTYLSEWAPKFPIDPGKRSIEDRSVDLLDKISLTRHCLEDPGQGRRRRRPIIFVTHSMGGLLVKQMLLNAARDQDKDPRARQILQDTMGVVFYSTPHKGSPIAKFTSRAHPIFYPSLEVKQLQLDSPELIEMNQNFVELVQNNSIACLSFGETQNINLSSYIKMMVVPRSSSELGYGDYHPLNCNHLYICKPHTRESPQYSFLFEFVQNILLSNRANFYSEGGQSNVTTSDMTHSKFTPKDLVYNFSQYNLERLSLKRNRTIFFPLYD